VNAAGGRVAWIATAPVKGLRLALREEAVLERTGIEGDRVFYLVDAEGRLTNAKRAGGLLRASAATDGELLRVRLPDGAAVDGEVELGDTVETNFYGRSVRGRVVRGPWAEALSAIVGLPLTLVRAEEPGSGLDRGAGAAASLVSTAALGALARAAGVDGPVDGRRFRMNLGVDGITAHEEDGWLGRPVAVGEAVLIPRGNVGRCRVTKLGPETGVPDLETLDVIADYRATIETTEPLPFGVWCEVVEPGRVAVGDRVEPVG
jgi:MOSC domain-containing protein